MMLVTDTMHAQVAAAGCSSKAIKILLMGAAAAASGDAPMRYRLKLPGSLRGQHA